MGVENIKYSVLMSVYHKEKPEYLKESIESMLAQTVKPDEVILVKDGPLTDELERVINEYKACNIIMVIELKRNVGLGTALNIGLEKCKNEIIARMDTDDVSEADRCEKQLVILMNEDVSVVGTSVAEFIDTIENIVAYKEVVENHNDIKNAMKFRNAVNHPTVMFKKADVQSVGSYKHWFLNEDYYLWIRMIQNGFNFKNLNEPLVRMRITNETYLRRGGWKYFITQKELFDYMLKIGYIHIFEYLFNNCIRLFARMIIPNKIRKLLYMKVLRKSKINSRLVSNKQSTGGG